MTGVGRRVGVTLALVLVLTSASVALAEPIVVVHVRRHGERADAEVLLRHRDGIVGQCRTEHGTCEIHGVPPGHATVSARPEGQPETPGNPVLIPPHGKVTLFVAIP